MPKGTIKLISDRGFGFIRTAEGKEVEFEVGRDRIGRAQAVKVRLAQPKSE